jgi:hypothetical protein
LFFFFLPIPWPCHIFSLFPSRSRPLHYSLIVDVNRSTARLRWRMHGAPGRGAIQNWTGSQAFFRKKNRQSFLVTYRRLPSPGPGSSAAGPRALRLMMACGRRKAAFRALVLFVAICFPLAFALSYHHHRMSAGPKGEQSLHKRSGQLSSDVLT